LDRLTYENWLLLLTAAMTSPRPDHMSVVATMLESERRYEHYSNGEFFLYRLAFAVAEQARVGLLVLFLRRALVSPTELTMVVCHAARLGNVAAVARIASLERLRSSICWNAVLDAALRGSDTAHREYWQMYDPVDIVDRFLSAHGAGPRAPEAAGIVATLIRPKCCGQCGHFWDWQVIERACQVSPLVQRIALGNVSGAARSPGDAAVQKELLSELRAEGPSVLNRAYAVALLCTFSLPPTRAHYARIHWSPPLAMGYCLYWAHVCRVLAAREGLPHLPSAVCEKVAEMLFYRSDVFALLGCKNVWRGTRFAPRWGVLWDEYPDATLSWFQRRVICESEEDLVRKMQCLWWANLLKDFD
jgi:hypothetical protein